MSNGNRTAAEHGTIAVLAIQTRGAARAMPFDQMLEVNAGPTTTWVQRDGRPFDPLYGMQAAAMDRRKWRRCCSTVHPGPSTRSSTKPTVRMDTPPGSR